MSKDARQLFDPAFRNWRLRWLFTAIIVCMVYLATFAVLAEMALGSMAITWKRSVQNHITVEIRAADNNIAQNASLEKQVVALLQGNPNIEKVVPLSRDDIVRILKPWIDRSVSEQLPLPTLIDVKRKSNHSLSAANIQAQLQKISPLITVSDHADWMADSMPLIHGLLVLAGLIIILTGGVLIIAVMLVCHAVMASEHEMIDILHIMGASDERIAALFAIHTRHLSWPAAGAGFALAIASFMTLLFFVARNIGGVVLPASSGFMLILLSTSVPILAVWGASLSTRISVTKALRQKP